MSILKLESKDYTKMLWKNGQGSTLEIDKGQGWRLSIATVNQDGAFSKFEGMQRIISMISGDAIELISSQQDDVIIRTFESHAFSGDEDIYCKVHGTGGQDLNLIYDSKKAKVRFELSTLQLSSIQIFTASKYFFIFNPTENMVYISFTNQYFILNQYDTLKIMQSEAIKLIHFKIHSKSISPIYLIEITS